MDNRHERETGVTVLKMIKNAVGQSFNGMIRHLYWIYRLAGASMGKGVALRFPIIVEGRGRLVLGDGCALGRRADLGIGEGGLLDVGPQARIDGGVMVRVGRDCSLRLGRGALIESCSRLYINSRWEVGDGSTIATNCAVFAREKGAGGRLIMGNNSHIGDNSTLDICDDLIIGDDVALGGYNIIYTHDHEIQSNGPAWTGDIKRGCVKIGNGAWVGAGVIILPNVSVGENAVIAAGSVVTRDVAAGALVGGVPARLLR